MNSFLLKTTQLYRDAYTGHPKEIWALAVLSFVNRVGTMVIPFLSVYLTGQLGFSLKEAGIIIGTFGVGGFVGSYFGGRATDRYGSSIVIAISLWLGGLFFILLQWATTLETLLPIIFITGLFGEAYRPAMTTAIGEYTPRNEFGRSMSLVRLAINLGLAAAPTFGGFIAIALGYEWLFWIDGVTCIVAATYFYVTARRWKKQKIADNTPPPPVLEKGKLRPHQDKTYLLFLLGTFFICFVFLQWLHSVPLFIKNEWHFDERYIGILLGTSCLLIVFFEMPITHTLEKNNHLRRAMMLGMMLIGGSYALFFLPKSLILCFLAVNIWTVGEILFMPLNNTIPINLASEGRRGEYTAWYSMMWALVTIVSPVFGLSFIDRFGFDAFWGLLLVFTVLGLTLSARTGRGKW